MGQLGAVLWAVASPRSPQQEMNVVYSSWPCAAPALHWPKNIGRKGSERWEMSDALNAKWRRPQLGGGWSF